MVVGATVVVVVGTGVVVVAGRVVTVVGMVLPWAVMPSTSTGSSSLAPNKRVTPRMAIRAITLARMAVGQNSRGRSREGSGKASGSSVSVSVHSGLGAASVSSSLR